MSSRPFVCALVLILSFVADASAEDGRLGGRSLRLARKMLRHSQSGDVSVLKNTTFDGVWGGRYSYSSRLSTCSNRVSGFNFQHVFLTRKGSGFLSTNDAGDLTGRSRDKGRRWEFQRRITAGGRPAELAIVYGNLSRNGNTATTIFLLNIQGGCLFGYQATAVRLAR
jgi:hypothetical protein